ncbi:AraC family transcriptional regulator [Planococcus ruber]|uniref:AraC family transcriptional regulator n=1 Tax=Planococcus ruber TaxID=2027871 RepID=UPI001FEDC91A|nr:AraC family transcriptional regulator [Planococcus ruber]MCJ1907650.1 AraC family transcriptional regulator [Planococcus ruber]
MPMLNHVICEKRTYQKDLVSHQHEYGQFLFPLHGSVEIKVKEQEIKVDSTKILYLPPKLDHHYRSKERNEFLILDVPLQYLPELGSKVDIAFDSQWSAIRHLLLEELHSSFSSSSLMELTRYIISKLPKPIPPSIDYIHQHFKEPIGLETLAAIEHYHPVYYSAWFKKQTGKSFTRYISDLRLTEAKNLLAVSAWPITKISEELGFENSSSFIRWFGNHEGISPLHYRILQKR